MKLNKMTKEELEVLSYTDLTEMILKENGKAMNTASIFKTICNLLELTEEDYANKIGDYYTSLTTDKRFILLETANWDLRTKHKVQIVVDDEEEDDVFDDEEEKENDDDLEEESNDEESLEITDDEVDLDDDDDLDDLTIVGDEELDQEN